MNSNIRPAKEPPMRNGEVDPANRTEPLVKPEITDQLLRLAGIKEY